jgi:hypothetical protein
MANNSDLANQYRRMREFKNIENQELIQLRDFLLPLLMNGQVKVKETAEETLSIAAESKVEYIKGKFAL